MLCMGHRACSCTANMPPTDTAPGGNGTVSTENITTQHPIRAINQALGNTLAHCNWQGPASRHAASNAGLPHGQHTSRSLTQPSAPGSNNSAASSSGSTHQGIQRRLYQLSQGPALCRTSCKPHTALPCIQIHPLPLNQLSQGVAPCRTPSRPHIIQHCFVSESAYYIRMVAPVARCNNNSHQPRISTAAQGYQPKPGLPKRCNCRSTCNKHHTAHTAAPSRHTCGQNCQAQLPCGVTASPGVHSAQHSTARHSTETKLQQQPAASLCPTNQATSVHLHLHISII
jgi:hypothetical protein